MELTFFSFIKLSKKMIKDLLSVSVFEHFKLFIGTILSLESFLSVVTTLVLLIYMNKNIFLSKKEISLDVVGINFKEALINFILLYSIIMFIFMSIFGIITHIDTSVYVYATNPTNPTGVSNVPNVPQTHNAPGVDPVRWWPSGVAINWGILGTAIGAYRLTPGSQRVKTLAGLASLGVSIPMTVFTLAVENPNGFNRLMYSWIEFGRTRRWPANNEVPASVRETSPSVTNGDAAIKSSYENNSGGRLNYMNSDSGNGNEFYDYINSTIDSLFKNFISYFNIEQLEGHFDELYGFIWFSQVLLFIISISVLILFILYVAVNIFVLNKHIIAEKIKDKNILIQFYFKYQTILGNISFYLLPLLIICGILEISYILYYLITHPLPIENLNIDIHTYVKKK